MQNLYNIIQNILCNIGIHNYELHKAQFADPKQGNKPLYSHYKVCKHCEHCEEA